MGHLVVVKGYCSGMRLIPLFARLTLGFSPITESLHGTESGGHPARKKINKNKKNKIKKHL